jgi:iduronate 2-sulfatase
VSDALAEAVDLYPTLSELAGLALPTGKGGEHLGGTSLGPVIRGEKQQVKEVTLSQFPRCWQNNTHHTGKKPGDEGNRTNSFMSMSDCHWTDR